MKRIYVKYNDWEDYNNGMYSLEKLKDEEKVIKQNVVFFNNEILFFNTGMKLLDTWVNSCNENLSNININRLAWIGQASCFLNHKSPEYLTKKSWKVLENKTKIKANSVAFKILKHYEKRYNSIHKKVGEPLLF